METNEEILKYPNKPYFEEKNLRQEGRRLKNKYDTGGYLSMLMVIANKLNKTFQETLIRILSSDEACTYTGGPIKVWKMH